MKVKSFIPYIVSKKSDDVVKTFEALGFEKNHMKTDANGGRNLVVSMKNPDGFKVDIAHSDVIPTDVQSIRINVEDFDEAVKEFEAMGFKNPQGNEVARSSSSNSCMMVAPSGFSVIVCKHIK